MTLQEYFDRIAIIHLPDRVDRYQALDKELSRAGIDIKDPKVVIPPAPIPETANGFKSRGVYGSFLSHLEILEAAERDGLNTVWVFEDDAILSNQFSAVQSRLAGYLSSNDWDVCFFGHSVASGLPNSPTGLVRFSGPFLLAHCYAVHRRILPRLISYLRASIDREQGHPEGGKLYIDAVYTLFRQFNLDATYLVAYPCLSAQKGCQSSLNDSRWYDRIPLMRHLATLARSVRDESWRRGLIPISQNPISPIPDLGVFPASCWPDGKSTPLINHVSPRH